VVGGVPAEDPKAPQLVIGANGNDALTGGSLGDILIAGAGKQTMTGGGGADQFVVNKDSTVKITDFQVGVDHLVSQAKLVDLGSDDSGNVLVGAGDAQVELMGVTPQQFVG
jgi:serralysin